MQTTSAAYTRAYEEAVVLRALPKVIVDWNHNRFSNTVTPSNGGNTAEDQTFPITSIAHSIRGRAGLVKSRVGEARTYRSKENDAPQYRTVGPNATYKYWSSTTQSDSNSAISGVSPQVVYGAPVLTNKIVVGTENTWSVATTWTLQITTDGTNWSTITSNGSSSIDASTGRLVVFLQNDGSWSTAYNLTTGVAIRGVRLSVTRMSKPNAHFNLIELSAHLERDLSDYVMTVGSNRSREEQSLIFPVGLMTSNTCNVSLDNTTEIFDRDNTASEFYGLLDSNAEVRVSYGTDVSGFGGGWEYLPQGTYFVDSWGDNVGESTVQISGTDFSKFFQAMQMQPVLFIDRTPGQIIAEILSMVGFRNYSIDIANVEQQAKIPYVWFTGEDNVWSAMQSICASTQGTLYTDEHGVMRYVSRNKAFENAAGAPAYAISAINSGAKLANLEDIQHNFEIEANKVVVNYTPLVANSRKIPVDKIREEYDIGPWKNSVTRRANVREYDTVPIDSVLWKPEDTVTLRAADLTRTMETAHTDFYLLERNAQTWPWSAVVNIEGEIVSYDGKEYRYWVNGIENRAAVKSKEEETRIRDMVSDIGTVHKNSYTGRFMNVKRGQQGTKVARHVVGLSDWTAYRRNSNNTVDHTPVRAYVKESHLVVAGYAGDNGDTYTYAQRGLFQDRYQVYGTRMRFSNSAYGQGTAGIYWSMQTDRLAGYFVEINMSSWVLNGLKGAINEIRVYRRNSNGTTSAITNLPAGGIAHPIVRGQWYDIDVTYNAGTGGHSLFFNGRRILDFTDPNGLLPAGTWGPFVRGHTAAEFEYFYVANNADAGIPDIEASSFQHKITGSYVSGWADREVQRTGTKVDWYFDDFGPWAHEMREFKVNFDKVPALDAHVYLSNTWDAYLLDGNRTPFDATFWIANSGRDSAVISGDDPTVYVGGGDTKQQLLVYGQLITEEEESSVSTTNGDYTRVDEDQSTVTYSNEYAIRKRGVVELSVDSNWIQSRSQAEAVGAWIVEHWSEPVDNVTVTGYFNPAIQLGDLVSVDYPDRNIFAAQHRYHVVGISCGFEQGISTSLTLRRVR